MKADAPRSSRCGSLCLATLLSVSLLACKKPPEPAGAVAGAPAGASIGAEVKPRPLPPPTPMPSMPPAARQADESEEIARFIRESYTKYEYRIPVRDGVALFTVVYAPKDRSRTYPILFTRTPYGVEPYGPDSYPGPRATRTIQRFAPSAQFVKEGYIFAYQDVRGRMMSEGTFVDVRPYIAEKHGPKDIDESSDAYDSIDWLVRHVPSNNGKVGMWGISYPGFYAAQAAIDAHPALKAVSPQAPVTDWFAGDDFHHNGALFLADAFDFYASFGKPRPTPVAKMTWGYEYGSDDGYAFFLRLGPLSNVNERHFKKNISFWNDLTEHATLDDFWKARDPRPHYRNIKPATLVVGGWFDAEDLYGTLETYKAIERQTKRGKNSLVMGPWKHGGWARSDGESLGDISFGAPTARWYQKNVVFPFFERHLKGKGDGKSPEAWVFETGTNEWHAHDAWPPPEAKSATLWFHPGGRLGAGKPTEPEPSFDEYLSDPAKPVPHQAKVASDRGAEYMIDDQRFAATRPDVLVYATGVLDEDVALAGPLQASLWVSTTGTDADFVVKVIDVYPESYPAPEPNPHDVKMGGYQQMVRAEIMRGKFRNSLERPEAFKPGEKTLVKIALPDVAHTFRAGHRIMVQVQSSWFPLVDRNPQQMLDIYTARASDFRAATHQVHLGGPQASGLTVTLLRGTLPAAPAPEP